ncbi:DUF4270 family protein [Butyricimonas paravirosa]|uniref:DUF4270 family protein n=1 Tax=Butyricimonas paravirosa TaxID=1472417 RepID=UPI00210C2A7C|nr:DUF4270 family protein [Butyricimonas paravirosa]MCQ4873499.1 DUF4270 domain-containing protein [Butyricimonas paravirosa]
MRIFFLLSFLFVLYSCNNDLNTIGDTMIPAEGYVEVVTQDIEESYTIRLDSFPTSVNVLNSYLSTSQLTLGKIVDNTTGTTIATPYFQIIGNGFDSRLNFDDNYTYDSLTLRIAADYKTLTLLAGDTTSLQTFYLHRLKDYPRMDYDDPCIYDNAKLDYEENALGRLQLRFEKNYLETSDLYFKLDDNLGRELFHLMQGRDSMFIYPLDFIRYFNGLVIVPDKDNSALLPIDATSLALKCHYHLGTSDYYFSLPAAGGYYAFTNITHTPSEILKGISWFNPKPFNETQMGVIQGLDGYMLKLQLPYLPPKESFKTIIKAEIELTPRLVNYENISEPTKSYIQVFTLDKYSKLTGALSDYSGNPVYGYLQTNAFYPDQRRYVIDITDYYISMVNNGNNIDPQLNLAIGLQGTPRQIGVAEIPTMVGSVATSFDRLILDDIPVLKIYYAKYK